MVTSIAAWPINRPTRRNINGVDRLVSRSESPRRSSGRNPRPNTSRLQPGIHRYPRDTDHAHVYLFFRCSSLSLSVRSSVRPSVPLSLSFLPHLLRIYLYTHSNIPANRTDPLCCSHTTRDPRSTTIKRSADICTTRISAYGVRTRKVQSYRNIHVCIRVYHRAIYAAKCITVGTTRISLSLSAVLFSSPLFSSFCLF